jgi:PAS domain S-box-containing protein
LEQIRYQALLLNNVHDAVVVWDLDGRITFWNRAAEALFGWEAGTWLGQRAADCYLTIFTPPLELPELAAGEPVTVERRGRRRSGEEFWVDSSLTALEDAVGRVIGVMDISRDVTARKRLEEQVRAAQAQLTQAVRLSAIGELASGVAHQISNPLTTIIAETQLLRREVPADSPIRESLEAIERGGWRAQEAVQRLLDFSRPASTERELLSVNRTIAHAVALVGGLIETIGVRLEVDLPEGLPEVPANARQLEDLWVNLLLLARDGTDDGQPHTVSVRSSLDGAEQVQVVVADDGRPIPAAQLPTVFEPDFTGPPAGRGTGLELSICREIVRQHAGVIAADSAPGRGVSITVLLPTR